MDDQTRRDSKRKDDDDDADGDQEIQPEPLGAAPEEQLRMKENVERKGREEQRNIKGCDPDDTARSTRDFDRKEHHTERDSRKLLMPNVLHRSSVEDSFKIGALDSQVHVQ